MSERPESVTSMRHGLFGLACMVATTVWLVRTDLDPVHACVLLMAVTAVPIALLDLVRLRVHRRASTGIDWDRPVTGPNPRRILTRWAGAAGAVAAVAWFYWITPEYQGSFYDPFYRLLRWYGPPVAVGSLVYLAWIDGRLADPHDGYWHLGRALTGGWSEVRWDKVADLGRGWLIKGFFVPLMFVYFTRSVGDVQRDFAVMPATPDLWFDALWRFSVLVDLVFTTGGYLVTVRLLDTHLRSAQPGMTGWVAAMVCYQPFFSLIGGQYVHYDDGFHWGTWLNDAPALKLAWGVGLLATAVVFSGSTVAFGNRFSNLTNRGTITTGFYRYTKHPAYVSKLAGFFMMYVPFVYHGSVYDLVRDCFWLGFLAFIYWVRARTEEVHLSEDPDYVRYGLWMNDHGVFAPLGRLFPVLRYRPPEGVIPAG